MAGVYSERFTSGTLPLNADTPIFVTPSSDIWELRDVLLTNASSAAATMYLLLNHGSFSAYYLYEPGVPAFTTVHLDLRQILPPTSTLSAYSSQASSTYALSGYHFVMSI